MNPSPDPRSARAPRVLVVDDEEIVRSLISAGLGEGYTVVETDCGREALDLLDRRPFDAVLLDFTLDGRLSGREVYSRLVERRPELAERVVFCTGDSFSQDTWAFLDETGRPVLWKPFDLDELRAVVAGVVAASRIAGDKVA